MSGTSALMLRICGLATLAIFLGDFSTTGQAGLHGGRARVYNDERRVPQWCVLLLQ